MTVDAALPSEHSMRLEALMDDLPQGVAMFSFVFLSDGTVLVVGNCTATSAAPVIADWLERHAPKGKAGHD